MEASEQLTRIIEGCKKGEPESFRELLGLYAGRCHGYFFRLSRSSDVSDDLLSELFVKLVEKIGSYRGENFDGWLFAVAGNIFRDHLRRKKRDKLVLADDEFMNSAPAKKVDDEVAMSDELQMYLGRLDEETRELIVRRFYSEMSFKELAAARGEPIGTTLSKVHRGLKRLRELME